MKIIKNFTDLNIDNIRYLSQQNLENNEKFIRIKYSENDPFCIQTPFLSIPFGIGKNITTNLHYLDLSLTNSDNNFKKIFQELDSKILNDAFIRKNEWFKDSNYDADRDFKLFINNIYNKQIKTNMNDLEDIYFDYIRVYLPKIDNKWYFEIFNEDKNNITENDEIEENIDCRCILYCDGLWFEDNEFGVSWRMGQMQIKSNNSTLKEFSFTD